MSYSYNMEQPYSQTNYQNNVYYQNQSRQKTAFEKAVNSAAIGFAGGSIVSIGADFIKNRKPVINGEVNDSFAKQVLDKIIDKGYTFKNKEFFNQKSKLLNKLKNIKSPEKFKKIMNKYKVYASTLCDSLSLDSMCETVNKDNLKGKISALKNRIEASMEPEIRNIKDIIKLCWNKEEKKFEKPKEVSKKIFTIIKNTKNSVQWKKMFKYGGITAGIFGALTLGFSVFNNKNNV